VRCYTFPSGLRKHRGGTGVKVRVMVFALIAATSLLFACSRARAATTFYVSQSGGAVSGGSACNGQNTKAATSGLISGVGPGDTIYLCGTISTHFTFTGSGTAASPITIIWDKGAKLSANNCGAGVCWGVSGSYVILNGGTPCGPGTACAATEAADPQGYPSGITGIVEQSLHGTPGATCAAGPCANPSNANQMIWVSGSNVTVENLILRNCYLHTTSSDNTGDSNSFTALWTAAPYTTIHDNTIHDCSCGIMLGASGEPGSNETIYRNNLWNYNWGVAGGSYGSVVNANTSIHDNIFGSTANWDDTNNTYHHDRVMMYADTSDLGAWNGFYLYNNVFTGPSGLNSTAQIYMPGGLWSNAYFFNNIFTNAGQTTAIDNGLFTSRSGTPSTYGAGTKVLINNTIMGAGPTIDTREGCVDIEDHLTFVNNVVAGCSEVVYISNTPYTVFQDYNVYGNVDPVYVFGTQSGHETSLAAWQAYLAGPLNTSDSKPETHSYLGVSNTNIANKDGSVPSSSPVSSTPGYNYSSLCSLNSELANLCYDTTAGGTRTPTARPSSGAWTVGAFNIGGSAPTPPSSNQPAPPTKLGATVQ
jgi:hypothetical protein